MSTRPLILLAMILPATVAVIACSSAPAPAPAKDHTTDPDDTKDQPPTQSADVTSKPAPAPTPTPSAAPPPAPVLDAGLDAAKPPPTPVQPPPGQTTQFCAMLSRCCGNLDTFNAIACTGTALAGDETACGVELAVCNAGGIDFGGLFGTNN
jgi:hypothetical protein